MEFRKLTLDDREAITEKMGKSHDFLSWEYDFCDVFLWDVYDVSQIYRDDDFCFIYTVIEGRTIFYPPYLKRKSDFCKAINMICNYCRENKTEEFSIIGLTKEQTCQLDMNKFILTTDEGSYDYIYSAQELTNLTGKKFHAKRNFVNKFVSAYEYEITDYSDGDYDDIMELFDQWEQMHNETNVTLMRERQAVKRALNHYRELQLKICEIKICGKVEAFSVSSLYNEKVGHTIFEKANLKFDGIFQAINKFTAVRFFDGCVYVNREEDMNIEGLRKAKKSYNPVMLWEKYNASCKL